MSAAKVFVLRIGLCFSSFRAGFRAGFRVDFRLGFRVGFSSFPPGFRELGFPNRLTALLPLAGDGAAQCGVVACSLGRRTGVVCVS